jgi:uncharacterized Zn-binding protein involved in type VI secretion
MPQAVTLGDQTSHGTPLGPGPGSNNVFIGGKPSFRSGIDKHACPGYEGSTAHMGGVVQNGSSNVYINGHSAVRKGDKVSEVGVSNSIISGNASVEIN